MRVDRLGPGVRLSHALRAGAWRALGDGPRPARLAQVSAVTEFNLHVPALLPDSYCGDVHIRLSLYKRLASAGKAEQIDALLEELKK